MHRAITTGFAGIEKKVSKPNIRFLEIIANGLLNADYHFQWCNRCHGR